MEACLFCDSDKESSALEPEKMFICGRCRKLLEAQDDVKLIFAYDLAVQNGKYRKAMALKMVLDSRQKEI